jgi:16S rRNA (guanine966-N2)-methyltransferase
LLFIFIDYNNLVESKLQIISGRWHGHKLALPFGARPTQNCARIALFNMLMNSIFPLQNRGESVVVWDAFAGSGAFGLECISRFNNAKVIFTDTASESIKTIQKNLESLGVCKSVCNTPQNCRLIIESDDNTSQQIIVEQTDAISAVPKFGATADLIFIDPPYANAELGAQMVEKLSKTVKPGAIIIWEFEKNYTSAALPENMQILRDKTYGRARFLIISYN